MAVHFLFQERGVLERDDYQEVFDVRPRGTGPEQRVVDLLEVQNGERQEGL